MTTPSATALSQLREYQRSKSVVFLKTKEAFGGLSNMASGFPLRVNDTRILSSEALYQACRFPNLPKVQRVIIAEQSPMTAKMRGKPYRSQSRPDWDSVRVKIMRWCLRVKLAQNWDRFSELLLQTNDRPIVEQSRKDDFWGAKAIDNETLIGMNVLGRLLMEVREEIRNGRLKQNDSVAPPLIPHFLLLGRPIEPVEGTAPSPITTQARRFGAETRQLVPRSSSSHETSLTDRQSSLKSNYGAFSSSLTSLKPYAAYKESGVSWLGQVPQHWEVLPNRALFAETSVRDRADEEMLSVTIVRGVVRQNSLLEEGSKKDSSKQDKAAYKLVCPGDIAYNKMRAWQGAIGVSDLRGIVSPAYVVVRPRNGVNSRFFHYLFRTPQFAKEAERWSYGITSDMWSLRPEQFRLIYAPLAPPSEQLAITRFLDHTSRQVGRYVRARQNLIKRLEELKSATIHRAVTRGLGLDVALKPTGVGWLGDIPAHWSLYQLRRLVRRGKKITYGIVQPGEPDPTGRFMIRGQDYSTGWAAPETIFRVSEEVEVPYKRSRLSPGDLVVTIVGAGVGNVAVVPDWLDGANITQTTARVAIDPEKADKEYVRIALQGPVGRRNVEYYVKGAAQPGLNLEHLRIFGLPLPPLAEQRAIAEKVGRDTQQIDSFIRGIQAETKLLNEYCVCLITNVVTGKLDVRATAAELPDNFEDAILDIENEDEKANEGEGAEGASSEDAAA